MDAYWHPVCPACREQVTTVAFPGDERGPVKPEQHSLLSNVFCVNRQCARMVDLHRCSEWRLERLWNDGRPDVIRMVGWGLLSKDPEPAFTY